MSRLAQLQKDLQNASAAVAHAERTVAAHPNVPSVLATLRTIQVRRASLEEQFFTEAAAVGLDVCGYRIEHEGSTASISGLTAVLNTFQKIFTTVYNALENGVKKTTKVSAEIERATSFGFAYSFPGSVGVMMTLPNDKLLFESKLDEAMDRTFELITASDVETIQALTETVGLPAVRLAHEWAAENVKAGFGADITWRKDKSVKRAVRVQVPEIAELESAIRNSKAKEQITVTGDLLDVAITEHTFRMKVGDKIIQGTFDSAITALKPVQLPKTYEAVLTISQRIVLPESGQEQIEYYLVRIGDPQQPTVFLTDLSD
jgi:hypothetical protein